jgi:hypothetical protein
VDVNTAFPIATIARKINTSLVARQFLDLTTPLLSKVRALRSSIDGHRIHIMSINTSLSLAPAKTTHPQFVALSLKTNVKRNGSEKMTHTSIPRTFFISHICTLCMIWFPGWRHFEVVAKQGRSGVGERKKSEKPTRHSVLFNFFTMANEKI